MEYIDVKKAAERWSLTERRITALCRNGKISGAKKENGLWLIPDGAEKPADGRKSKVRGAMNLVKKLPLPIGVSNFKELVDNYYYVDKTLLLRDFIDTRAKVSLFTRPRRFGKTLTMDMIKTFFEISDEDTAKYFRNLKIWSCGEKYRQEQGRYPIIFITFKDVKFASWEESYASIREIIATEYLRHEELLTSDECNVYDKEYYRQIASRSADEVVLSRSLHELSQMLNKHYGKPVIIIIDEYDTPIQQGYNAEYYDKVVLFMRNLFSGAFKDNNNLAYGFMTGILRVAKESIFSGLNNLKVNSIFEDRYSEYFGFTKDEIYEMLKYYGHPDKFNEVCDWYDGYRFGETDIFNPWSTLNYMDEKCTAKAFWQSTGDNSIIRQIVAEADDETSETLRRLMQGDAISSYVDASVIYPDIKKNPTTIYSFLLAAGYLKTVNRDNLYDGNSICDIKIPNREIFYVYEKEILSAMTEYIPQSTAIGIQQAIIKQDTVKLQAYLEKLLVDTISSFDYSSENFYHGLMLGICALMNNQYKVDSNRESGLGRYDIQLKPLNHTLPGIIMELKVAGKSIDEDNYDVALDKMSEMALEQIDEKQYVTSMRQDGITNFLKIGVAFWKKHVKVVSKTE